MRLIRVVHRCPGRVRLRLNWLREDRAQATAVADRLADLDGIEEVRVRPLTGSVLVRFNPARIDEARLAAVLSQVTGVERVLQPGEELPAEMAAYIQCAVDEGSKLSRAAVRAAKGLNLDLLRFSEGHLSLGTLMALLLIGGSALKLALGEQLELPEWHQLAWWGFRSFATLEEKAIEQEEATLDLHP